MSMQSKGILDIVYPSLLSPPFCRQNMTRKRPGGTQRHLLVPNAFKALLMITVLASLLLLSMNATRMRYQAQDAVEVSLSHYHKVDNLATLQVQHDTIQHSPQALRSDNGKVMLLDPERTLWTAGWNARHTRYYKRPIPAISWTVEAESTFEKEYRRLHFPSKCADVKGYVASSAGDSLAKIRREEKEKECHLAVSLAINGGRDNMHNSIQRSHNTLSRYCVDGW